jgi:hypothetical protein
MTKNENEFLKKMAGKDVPKVNESNEPKVIVKEEPKKKPNVNTNVTTNENDDIASIVDAFYQKQNEKELKQDIAGNYTLVIKHAIMERLDELAEHYPRGFKSDLVNEALETFVSLYEKKPLPEKRKKRGRR